MNPRIITVIAVLLLAGLFALPVTAANTTDYAKVYVIPVTVQDSGVSSGTVTLVYGHGPALGLQAGTFRGELMDAQGTMKKSFAIWDPRVRFGDSAYVTADGKVSKVTGVYEKAASADLTLIVPFSKEYASFRMLDEHWSPAASVELTPVLDRFCAANPGDPDCTGRSTVFSPFLIGVAALVLLLVTGAGWYFLKKKA